MIDGATVDATLLAHLDAVVEDLADPLMERQFELEAEMIEDGQHRYWDRVMKARPGTDAEGRYKEGEESRTPASQCLFRMSLNPVKEGLEELLAQASKAGRPPLAMKHLRLLDAESVAFLILKRCLDALSTSPMQSTLCVRLGRALEDEVRLRTFEKQCKPLLLAIKARFKTANAKHQRRVFDACARRYEVDLGARWSETEALQVGAAMLTIVIERTGLFHIVQEQWGEKDSRTLVKATDEAIAFVRRMDASAQFLFPTFMPMVVPPKPWTTPTSGGYHFGLSRKLKMVKSKNRGYLAELREREMPLVYRAVNAMQETPWEINRQILNYLLPAAKAGTSLGGLPETRMEPLPPVPVDIPVAKEDRTPEQQQRLVAWKSATRVVYETNIERRQKGLVLARTVAIAEKYAGEDRFYFPHTLDFRGRAYPATSFLQPQGCDYQKALLRFADGKPLGDQGACWLAIHGANLMAEDPNTAEKLDKLPLQQRVDWVLANEARILEVAADPDATDWWTVADSPWQFLAFCFEWAGYLAEGEGFVSRLPVAMDGSCNGLQHFSAMLRDEVGGSAVNLLPHEKPADIYMEVCKRVLDRVMIDADHGVEHAAVWLASGQINRSMCKRPVMTMPYGSKQFGIRDQLVQELRKREFKFQYQDHDSDGWPECGYLAAVIWESLGAVVVKARQAMDWLQACARAAASEGLPISWSTPTGFIVQQDYRETYLKKVKTHVAGVLLWPRLTEDKDTISKHRQQNGVAPNFVHSMDSSAMMLCINAALDQGITGFAMIHDSYGTHAADTEALFHCIRQSFIAMYEETDVLAMFLHDISMTLPPDLVAEMPPIPDRGSLDLALLGQSDFFFA